MMTTANDVERSLMTISRNARSLTNAIDNIQVRHDNPNWSELVGRFSAISNELSHVNSVQHVALDLQDFTYRPVRQPSGPMHGYDFHLIFVPIIFTIVFLFLFL